jgi:hypothetical protein
MPPATTNTRLSFIESLLILVGVLTVPGVAWAWGPVAHLDFSFTVLAGLPTLLPALRRLLAEHRADYLYGALAADSVVGKNMAREHVHCHNWKVAHRLLEDARHEGPETEAFMHGYIGHLAADVVAHNDFVPHQLVRRYSARGAGHLYWEARFDCGLLRRSPTLADELARWAHRRIPDHDRFLAQRLEPIVFSHRLSSGIFHRSLGVQNLRPWRRTLERLELSSRHAIGADRIERWRAASIEYMRRAIVDPFEPTLVQRDPTGRRAIRRALAKRRFLRATRRRFRG